MPAEAQASHPAFPAQPQQARAPRLAPVASLPQAQPLLHPHRQPRWPAGLLTSWQRWTVGCPPESPWAPARASSICATVVSPQTHRLAPRAESPTSWPAHRWLPVRYDQVAPDLLHYAYVGEMTSAGRTDFPPQSQGNLHVVDVAAGRDRVVLKGGPWTSQQSGVWGVIRYATEGIYLQKEAYASSGNWGVWLVDPVSGAMREILPESIANTSYGSGAAWTGSSTDVLTSSAVYRIDPSTRERVLWFSKPNPWLWYAGSDASGKPLIQWIQQAPAASELWVLSGPSQGSRLYSGPQNGIPFPSRTATDSRGVWAGSLNGGSALWLLTNDDKLVKVADIPVEVLGTCQ
jgi:hypothetical protein